MLANVVFRLVLTNVNTSLSELALFFFSHQLNSLTHLTVTQSKTELLNLSIHVKEYTNLQPRNGYDIPLSMFL